MLTINYPALTPEQIELIPEYRHKWQQIALNSEPIDRDRATAAINNVYDYLEIDRPNIAFFPAPNAALEYIYDEISRSWGKLENSNLKNPVAGKIAEKLVGNFNNKIQGEIYERLQGNLDNGKADRLAREIATRFSFDRVFSLVWAHASSTMLSSVNSSEANELTKAGFNLFLNAGVIFNRYISPPWWEFQQQINQFFGGSKSVESNNFAQMYEVLFTGKFILKDNQYRLPQIQLSSNTVNVIVPSVMADYAYYIDYLHQVLNCDLDVVRWNLFEDLITSCGWIFPYQETVLICDRL